MHFQLSESIEYAELCGIQQKADAQRFNAPLLLLTSQVFPPVLHSNIGPPVFY